MDFEDEFNRLRFVFTSALIVTQPCSVGRSNLNEASAGLLEHLGNPETAANLNKLASADGHTPTAGVSGQYQNKGSGAVVDYECSLGPAHSGQHWFDTGAPRASLSGRQIELEIGVADGRSWILRSGKRCPSEVGVQQHPGCIDD